MRIQLKRLGIVFAMVAGLGVLAAGCYVEPAAGPTTAPVVSTSYYQPLYYNGYVVYYDNYGRPFYYLNGGTYYIPQTYAHYHHYVRHYRTYRPHYYRWYRYRGYRYRRYRLHRRYRHGYRYRGRVHRRHHRRTRRHHRRTRRRVYH